MPVSVVIGGQFGSEGKGKVALHVAQTTQAVAVVRVGGPNSGHTAVDADGSVWTFRQLPAAALARQALVILPAGSLIDPGLLMAEVELLRVDRERLLIDSRATVVMPHHREQELAEGLKERIGSTASGTGAALRERLSRSPNHIIAADHPSTKPYVRESCSEVLRDALIHGHRVVIEGTQGLLRATSCTWSALAPMPICSMSESEAHSVVPCRCGRRDGAGGGIGPLLESHLARWERPRLAREGRHEAVQPCRMPARAHGRGGLRIDRGQQS